MLSILRTELAEPEMGAEDDFYAMGGDSIIALRVVADANEVGIPIELRDLLFHPTARQIAAALDRPARPAEPDDPVGKPFDLLEPYDRAIVAAGVVNARPASALQLGLLYLCESAQDPRLYHDLVGVEVQGPFDENHFTRALAALCERHEALRSSFDLGEFSEPVQLVWSTVPPPLSIESATTADAVARWRHERLGHWINWGRPPLFHCHVVVLPTSFHVTLAIHHAVIDGWSYARLVVELLLMYEGAVTGQRIGLPVVPEVGYDRFHTLQRAAIDSPAAADFWQVEADVPPLLFRPERFRATADPAETVSFPVDPATLEGLKATAGHLGVPLKSLVLGCHAGALGRWAGRDGDVVTGLTANGRPEMPGADLLVGLFLNTVPVRFSRTDGGWADLARAALAAEQRALPHRRYPLARIEQRLGRRSFDVSFNFTHFHVYHDLDRLRQLRLGHWWSFDKTSFPVLVDFMIDSRRAGTGVEVAYDPGLVTKEQAEEFAGLYHDLLDAAATRARVAARPSIVNR